MRFSVIIPLFNKAPYVKKALQSVAAQTFIDYELIVVDDGSKDESASIVEKWIESEGQSTNARLIRQENQGVSMARNNGVGFSNGDFLCFLDADDWWEPTFLEQIDGLITRYPGAGIYGTNYTIINETKHKTRKAPIQLDEGFEEGYINYCEVYGRTLCMPLTSISVAIPRLVFDEMGGFPKGIRLGEDFILWVHIALKHKVVFLDKALSNYNQDVDINFRGTHHLHAPQYHMLWNLQDLEPEEKSNPDYKQLIDKLRTSGLLPYYIDRRYHEDAKQELSKVDWTKQSKKLKRLYQIPVCVLLLRNKALHVGSRIKQAYLSAKLR